MVQMTNQASLSGYSDVMMDNGSEVDLNCKPPFIPWDRLHYDL